MTLRKSAKYGPFTFNQLLSKASKVLLVMIPASVVYYMTFRSKETSPLLTDSSATPVDMKDVFAQWNSVRETLSPFWLDTPLRRKLTFDQVTEVDYLKEMQWKIVDGKVVFNQK